jgi:hypothetical protein
MLKSIDLVSRQPELLLEWEYAGEKEEREREGLRS